MTIEQTNLVIISLLSFLFLSGTNYNYLYLSLKIKSGVDVEILHLLDDYNSTIVYFAVCFYVHLTSNSRIHVKHLLKEIIPKMISLLMHSDILIVQCAAQVLGNIYVFFLFFVFSIYIIGF